MHRLRQRYDHRRTSATRGTDARPVTRVLGALLAAAAIYAIALPTGGSAAQATIAAVDITNQSSIVVDTFAVSLPSDPNRCVTTIFVEFPDIQGAVSYSARISNHGYSPPREQIFTATPPTFPHDRYTLSLGPQTKVLVAPAGHHRIFISDGSSGSGCAPGDWIDLLSMTANVDDANSPPVASFTWEARDGEPLTVGFDASASTDDDAIQSYAWTFGDGGAGSGVTPSHAFAVGTYVVRLTVTDNDGATGSQEQSVTVSSGDEEPPAGPPVAAMGALVSQSDPYTFLLDGSGSTDDGQIVSYEWDFGDGEGGSGATTTHSFPGHGTYDVSLTVTDDDGLEDTTVREVLANAPPDVRVAWSPSATNPLAVDVDASQSTDDSEVVSYEWTFGDGTSGSGQTTTHEYAASGAYSATLIVSDDDGTQVETSFGVFVTGDGAYRLELPAVHGEEADLLLDESGEIVAVECSLGSMLQLGIGRSSEMLGSLFDPDCVDGFLSVDVSTTVSGALEDLPEKFKEAFDANKLFPQSTTDKSFSQMLKAFDIEDVASAAGKLQGIADTVELPPAPDGVVSVTPRKKAATSLAKLLTTAADGYQRLDQGLSGLQTWVEGLQQLTPVGELSDGAYRLELPAVHGEEADLLLDESGEIVAVECSLGSMLQLGIGRSSEMLGSLFDPDCVDGFLSVDVSTTVSGALEDLPEKFKEAFDANKLFPQSTTDKSFSQMLKAFDIEDVASAAGKLQGIADTVELPPAPDGVVSVTPRKKAATSLAKLLTTAADGYQRLDQGLSGLQTWVEGLQQLTPEAGAP